MLITNFVQINQSRKRTMKQTINIQHLGAYTEDNRLEAKRAKGGLPALVCLCHALWVTTL
jgi:hypothetical protein